MTIPNRNLGLLFFCEDFLSKSPRIFSENRSSWSEKLQKVYPNNWMQLDPLYSSFSILWYIWNTVYIRSTPHPVTVTTRIIAFLVGNPYKPSFATVTGWGVDPMYIYIYIFWGGRHWFDHVIPWFAETSIRRFDAASCAAQVFLVKCIFDLKRHILSVSVESKSMGIPT